MGITENEREVDDRFVGITGSGELLWGEIIYYRTVDDLKDGVYNTERFKKLLGVGRSEQDMWTKEVEKES